MNIKLTIKKIISCAEEITFSFTVIIFLIAISFLYVNCYQVAGEAQTVSILKKQVALKIIDIDLWDKIKKDIEWKERELPTDHLINRNPFE